MNKIITNFKYRTGFQAKWMGLAVAIYIPVITLTFFILIHFNLVHQGEGTLVYRLSLLLLVLFAMAMRFREDFNFLLTLSNTRKDIFKSFTLSAAFLSLIVTVLIVLERIIIDILNKIMNLTVVIDPFNAFAPYATSNWAAMILFIFSASISMCAFALLSGSLFYRLGKVFTTFYWITLSTLPLVIFPLILWIAHIRNKLSEVWYSWGYTLGHFNLWISSGVLLMLALLFSGAAYLNIRKLPQN